MKSFEIEVINDLIEFYSLYIELGLVDVVKDKAKILESNYLFSSTLISDDVFQLIGRLVDFYAITNMPPQSVTEAKANLIFLKKRLNYLKDDN